MSSGLSCDQLAIVANHSRTRNGNSLAQPLHRPSCWPKSTCFFWRYGTGASMVGYQGMEAHAVQLPQKKAHDIWSYGRL